jgi:hypothetical protein
MSLLFILFILSLLSISIMIGRKLVLLRNGELMGREEIIIDVPVIEEIKLATGRTIRKVGYVSLVTGIRVYFRSANYLKARYEDTKEKITELRNRNKTEEELADQKEISKFLKVISEYKHKIRTIKHKIREEERSL